jgi:AcrR family transcriptional regulator
MNDQRGSLQATLVRTAVAMLNQGTGEISLRAVARAAGVSAMAPYRHFQDKIALLQAVADHGFTMLRADLEEADRSTDGEEALIAQGLAYLAFAERHPALFRLMFASDQKVPRNSGIGRTAYDVLSQRVAGLVPAAADTATLACWALVHGLATLALDGQIRSESAQARAVLRKLVDGLGQDAERPA